MLGKDTGVERTGKLVDDGGRSMSGDKLSVLCIVKQVFKDSAAGDSEYDDIESDGRAERR